MRPSAHRRPGGFTLVELMAVIAILSVLTVVAVFSYKKYTQRAHFQEGAAFLMDIKMKQEQYFMTYSQFVSTGDSDAAFFPADSVFTPSPSRPLPAAWGWNWDCSASGLSASQKGFCALGLVPSAATTWFQYVSIGWSPSQAFDPKNYITSPNRRWWFSRARSYYDDSAKLSLELRLNSEVGEVIEITAEK
jgi:prepilin-type N-terminal cleavage/methylation domain-containing protein